MSAEGGDGAAGPADSPTSGRIEPTVKQRRPRDRPVQPGERVEAVPRGAGGGPAAPGRRFAARGPRGLSVVLPATNIGLFLVLFATLVFGSWSAGSVAMTLMRYGLGVAVLLAIFGILVAVLPAGSSSDALWRSTPS
jgi:hypothetical protein